MEKLKEYWLNKFLSDRYREEWWERKQKLWEDRNGKIVRIQGKGQMYRTMKHDSQTELQYLLHLTYLIKQKDRFHLEEQVIPYKFECINGEVMNHQQITNVEEEIQIPVMNDSRDSADDMRFEYDRRKAVQYAERWWNSYNPEYRIFDVDCTNYVSQCLRAGGAPMRGAPVRERGWWYSGDNWSFSWAVAHSLRWYLSGSTQGLKGTEVENASELLPGDVICYDFQGDGRWDHNTIVVAKDSYGMPLVNAHTDNSRHRYWSYEDSTAWTPNMQYKFFRIGIE